MAINLLILRLCSSVSPCGNLLTARIVANRAILRDLRCDLDHGRQSRLHPGHLHGLPVQCEPGLPGELRSL